MDNRRLSIQFPLGKVLPLSNSGYAHKRGHLIRSFVKSKHGTDPTDVGVSSLNGLIFHSDQGWQYQHAYFRNTIEKCGIIQSMSRKGNCYDNSIMETFFGRLKNEMFYGCEKDYKSYEEFSTAMAKYIDYYNNERIQAKTKWMPPVKYRLASMG